MRVLVVSAWPPWPLDGARMILHHHLEHLAPRHRITVLAAGRLPGDDLPDLSAERWDLQWFGADRSGPREYARRRFASLRTGEPANVFRVEVPDLVESLEHLLRTDRPDVVHLMGTATARLAHRARAAGVPVVHMPIDAWRSVFNKLHYVPWWRRAIEVGQRRKVRRHEERHLPACDAVVVVAPGDAEMLRAAIPGLRVEVVANGIEPGPDPSPTRLDPGPVLGLHGVMSTLPNRTAATAVVEEVLPRVQASQPAARAVLIGRDPAPDVRRLAASDVEVTGEVADMRAALARIAVYVVPMTEGSGIKNKVLEAMAAGLPVVSTTLGLDGIGPGPGTVVADTVDEQAAAAVRLLADPEERARLGAAARRRVVETFRWEFSAAAIERLWEEAAAMRAAPS